MRISDWSSDVCSSDLLILSGGILALALFGSLGQDSKKKRLMGPDWVWWQRQTAYVPFVGQLAGRLRWRHALPGWAAFATGMVLWLPATWPLLPAGGPAALQQRWIVLGLFGYLLLQAHFGSRESLN